MYMKAFALGLERWTKQGVKLITGQRRKIFTSLFTFGYLRKYHAEMF